MTLEELNALNDARTPGKAAYDDGRTDGEERGKPSSIYIGSVLVAELYGDENGGGRSSGIPNMEQMDANGRALCAALNELDRLRQIEQAARALSFNEMERLQGIEKAARALCKESPFEFQQDVGRGSPYYQCTFCLETEGNHEGGCVFVVLARSLGIPMEDLPNQMGGIK